MPDTPAWQPSAQIFVTRADVVRGFGRAYRDEGTADESDRRIRLEAPLRILCSNAARSSPCTSNCPENFRRQASRFSIRKACQESCPHREALQWRPEDSVVVACCELISGHPEVIMLSLTPSQITA